MFFEESGPEIWKITIDSDFAENGSESFEKNMGWAPGNCVACLADCHGAAISEDVFNLLLMISF